MKEGVVDNQDVAYELVVELLAHQFAFPVQWIETQKSLLSAADGVDRLVELGPSKVLTGMAQKTLKRMIDRGERDVDPAVEFLASTQNQTDLCYVYDSVVEEAQEQPPDSPPTTVSSTSPPASSGPPPGSVDAVPAAVASIIIEDVPLTVEFVLRCLIARKLKRSLADIPATKTIKELCNGKSTLQNELVGDFHHEFTSIPDRPEDVPLNDWSSSPVSLGKTSSALVAKLVASKMPAKFGVDTVRSHVASKWGLGPCRQTAMLLFALTAEPSSRLGSHKAAEEFWDEIAGAYAGAFGITLQMQMTQTSSGPTATTLAIDPAAVAGFAQANNKMAKQQMAALAEFLQVDLEKDNGKANAEALAAELQRKLDLVTSELSDDFVDGILPVFNANKTRRYSSWWNTARQDFMAFFDDPNFGDVVCDPSALEPFLRDMANRAHAELVDVVKARSRQMTDQHKRSPKICAAVDLIQDTVMSAVTRSPKALCILPAHGPKTTITNDGEISYTESPRPGVFGSAAYIDFLSLGALNGVTDMAPFVSIQSSDRRGILSLNASLTSQYIEASKEALSTGYCLAGKNILVTGAGPHSIGAEVVRLSLMAGARVIATTSRPPHATAKFFQRMYEDVGSKGSELILVHFNQASALDCERLIDYIYDTNGLNIELDAVLPFAAAPEPGTEVVDISAKNELVHRLMLANVLRLLGSIIRNKRTRGYDCHPTQVLLPLSPNHGTFGGDGLYSESKLGLESLLNRVQSESWSDELSLCGIKIGWTRGTGLMKVNDIVAESIEKHGVLTFSVREMAFSIVMLMTQQFAEACENTPLMADLGGGLSALQDCSSVLGRAREEISLAADIAKAIQAADAQEAQPLTGGSFGTTMSETTPASSIAQRDSAVSEETSSRLKIGFPRLPDYSNDISPLQHLQGLNDPSDTVVVVGLAELGPQGSARLRWEIERRGKLSQAGYIEMGWLMGIITHVNGPIKDEPHYVGWVDAKTREPVADDEIQKRYGEQILQQSGIRMLEKESAGYDPLKKEFLEEIAVGDDLPEFETSVAAADAMRLKHGDNVLVTRRVEGSETCFVKIKRGATIMVPKAIPFNWGCVAGQLPTGWNPANYGIPQDLIDQLDPVTLYTICCVSEAFFSAGISDPLEIFKYIHLSEIGNYLGSSMGGALKTRNLYKDMYLDRAVQADVLQDTYVNTTAAWVNMLLVGSAGPIKTPVGACATGVESVDTGLESIRSGSSKMCIVGGFDDFLEEEAYGFAKMKATVNAGEQLLHGRLPSEMSRPTAASRAGFVEAHGCGVQLLCRGDIALQMGLPVYGIIAASTMAADKIGRSVPAPGQGVLTFARESRRPAAAASSGTGSPMTRSISQSTSSSRMSLSDLSQVSFDSAATPATPPATLFGAEPQLFGGRINLQSFASDKKVHRTTTTAPLRAALATWGLGIDDLNFASLHGTSTKANDTNEPEVLCKQMAHLGRDPGLPLWAICQKSVTGHPKAPAAAWMLNGALQALDAGEIPGNRNADSVDAALRSSKYICFPTRPVPLKDPKAFILNSFGFGQKGGQIIGVAPRYFFATLDRRSYDEYSQRRTQRKLQAERNFVRAIMANKIVRIQDHPPYDETIASDVLLDPMARISEDFVTGSYCYKAHDLWKVSDKQAIDTMTEKSKHLIAASFLNRADKPSSRHAWTEASLYPLEDLPRTVGIDLVQLDCFTAWENPIFMERNYTPNEQTYIESQSDGRSATASRWAAKEAVFKCLQTASKGAGAAMNEIEIISSEDEETSRVTLHGDAFVAARKAHLEEIQLSLSYEDDYVAAIALGIVGEGWPSYA